MSKPKFPVKPVGRILYSELHGGEWWDCPKAEPKYAGVCECKGFSLKDRPFSVVRQRSSKDNEAFDVPKLPFCVVFSWRNDKGFKNRTVRIQGRDEERMDGDTYYMMEVLERHATLSAAQKAMRRYATEAFEKVNDPPSYGEVCHNTCEGEKEVKIRVGDAVVYTNCPGIYGGSKERGAKTTIGTCRSYPSSRFSFTTRQTTKSESFETRTFTTTCITLTSWSWARSTRSSGCFSRTKLVVGPSDLSEHHGRSW